MDTDVGHDSKGEKSSIEKGSTGKHIVKAQDVISVRIISGLLSQLEKFLDGSWVHSRQRDICSHSRNKQQSQSEENLLPKLRNF